MTALRLITAAVACLTGTTATIYECSPDGVPYTIEAALAVAGPGDVVSLADGLYREPIVTMAHGEDGNPLVIEGGPDAIISAFSGDRSLMWSQKVVDIRHSWITLRGFTVDGHLDDLEEEESYVDKCIWIEGKEKPTTVAYRGSEVETSLIGFHMEDMTIMNCGMECVRMRNWVTNSVIANNVIEDCGIYDFRFQFDGKIGEAIYIGTSSNQWTDGPDGSNYNLVINNKLTPRGNECVDIKEGATMNVVENNVCAEQLDEESGCYDSRGNGNTFRNNFASDCLGAGIRLGGHVIDDFVYGVENDVYGNHFENTGVGSIKAMQVPQGFVCGNTCDGDCDVTETGDDEDIAMSWDGECPETLPSVPFIDDMDRSVSTTMPPRSSGSDDSATTPPRSSGSDDSATMPPRSSGSNGFATMPPRSSGSNGFATMPPRSSGSNGFATMPPRSSGSNGFATMPPRSSGSNGFATMPPRSSGSDDTDRNPDSDDDESGPATLATSNSQITPGAAYVGCFIDEPKSSRIMRLALEDDGMTTQMCEDKCTGSEVFGTQYGRECWCGDNGTNHLKYGESDECDRECAGDASQICGGKWVMSVYQYE